MDHWATVQFFFLLILSLVQEWLGYATLCSPFPRHIFMSYLLMHWLLPQSTLYETPLSSWISFAWQFSQYCSYPFCLCTFSYCTIPFQSTLHEYTLIPHSMNNQHFQQWPSIVYPLHKGVSNGFLDNCQPAVFPVIVVWYTESDWEIYSIYTE